MYLWSFSFFLAFVFIACSLSAQEMSIGLLKDWITNTDSTTSDLFDNQTYDDPLLIIDGIPYSIKTTKMDSLLSSYDFTKDRVLINFVNPKSESYNSIFDKRALIILITTESKKSRKKYIKNTLSASLNMFKEPTLRTAHGQLFKISPLLIVNGSPFDEVGSYEFLKRLVHYDLSIIDILDITPSSFLGRASNHGIVRVWLREK